MTIEDKIDKIYDMVHGQNVELQKHIVEQKIQNRMVTEHKNKIEKLEEYKNTSVGRQSVLSFLFGSIGTLLVTLFKH